jgi:hypothetical protein
MEYEGKIYSRTFKIGGDYDSCVHLSYTYKNGEPQTAKLPHLLYEPECSLNKNLERGGGSELMIKALLNYAHGKINKINLFEFDDMSHIDCIEKDMSKTPPRRIQRPLKLSYLSIVYNGMTWYEKHFNAKMIDKVKYNKYRERINFLTDSKEKVDFTRFLEIANPPLDQIIQLKSWYENAETYRGFFNSIPVDTRCEILLPWINNFMKFYLNDVFSDMGWEIDIYNMNIHKGGMKRSKNVKTRKIHRYYPSKYRILEYHDYHML